MYTSTLLLALLPAAFAAPLLSQRAAKLIPNKYIVRMKNDASEADFEEAKKLLKSVEHEYDFGGFKGFAGEAKTDTVGTLQASDAVSALISKLRHSILTLLGPMDPAGCRGQRLGLAF